MPHFTQTCLYFKTFAQEKDNASTKALQLEDNVENLKVKLSSTLSDKERLQQVSICMIDGELFYGLNV